MAHPDAPPALSGATRLAAVIGSPVRHSLSPVIFNAAFRATGLDWVYLAFEVAAAQGADAVRACRALGIEGLSVTMPHKDVAAATVDDLSARAAALGAVNCVSRRGDRLHGDNTDGPGFVAALRAASDIEVDGCRAVVLGAGGAARAIVHALGEAGAAEIVVVNRTAAAAEVAADLVPGVARVGGPGDVTDSELVVNATSVGMSVPDDPEAERRCPVDPDLLRPGQVVADIVYHPATTALLAAAGARGAQTVGGLGMLVHQAALAFEIWTGTAAPLAAMSDAAEEALRARVG